MSKRLDPELVHSLYLNCKKDQLKTGRAMRSAARRCCTCRAACSSGPLNRLVLRREETTNAGRKLFGNSCKIPGPLNRLVLRREDPTNAGQKLFGNSREIPDLLRLRQLLI
uniref:Uncharacterized protein n=1 Tax=Oryza meridionalis TaxID=40149 RepID=A0A0E0DXM8_9ORYZ